jgi:hypothetical protein
MRTNEQTSNEQANEESLTTKPTAQLLHEKEKQKREKERKERLFNYH